MKHIFLPAVFSLFLVACSSKKVSKTGLENAVTEQQLTAAKTKFPMASMEELQKGHDIYYSSCNSCHRSKVITSRSEAEWPKILDRMAKKARLSDEQKDAVYKYITGVLVSAKQ